MRTERGRNQRDPTAKQGAREPGGGPPPGEPGLGEARVRRAAALGPRRPHGAVEEALQSLLGEANRELAGVLRDVQAWRVTRAGAAPSDAEPGGFLDGLLTRAVNCALQQRSLQAELGALALTDGLTGLCNRRGFLVLAQYHLRLARRADRPMLLFFVDVDGLKAINDAFGHAEGDLALVRAARALERTFRDCDVLARLGGDEFAALAVEADVDGKHGIEARLRENLKAVTPRRCRYVLSVSVGAARFDSTSSPSIGRLMALADQAMYEHRRRRENPWSHAPAGQPAPGTG